MAVWVSAVLPLVTSAAAMAAVASAGLAVHQSHAKRQALAAAGALAEEAGALRQRLQDVEGAEADRDRARAASEAKSRFLATVSHEIRTPLSGVLGLADLLSGTLLTREQQSYVAAVRTSGEALMTLIDDILDFARIEAGRLELAAEPFDVTELVEGVVELLAPRAHGKGLEIASYVMAGVPARLIGDPNRVRQVLLNLAGNAVKFTEHGGVGVAVACRPDGTVLFTVSDTGPGVPPDRRAAIFDEFEQADGSTTRRHGGTGLGLAITRRIVAEMDGELGLGERDGGGALFVVAVPLPAAEPEAADLTAAGASTARRCLIVSSDTFGSAYLAGGLRDEGHTAVRVGSFVEALALLRGRTARYDVLFVDGSAGEDGARAVAAVARLAGIGKTVLMFSPFERRAFELPVTDGFDAWLVKPVRRASLAERLGRLRPRAPARPFESASDMRTLPKVRVLLVEDNPVNALIARSSLERLGAEVTHAEDGETAAQAAEAGLATGGRPFDLVLMDVCMPVLDGLEATRRIRAAEHGCGAAPMTIVGTTADAFERTRGDCENAGMDEVLIKPVDPSALRRLVGATASVPEARSIPMRA